METKLICIVRRLEQIDREHRAAAPRPSKRAASAAAVRSLVKRSVGAQAGPSFEARLAAAVAERREALRAVERGQQSRLRAARAAASRPKAAARAARRRSRCAARTTRG